MELFEKVSFYVVVVIEEWSMSLEDMIMRL